jgi:hypothetical protein
MDKPPKLISLGPGLTAPERFTYHVELGWGGGEYNIDLEVVFEAGRFVVDRLIIQRSEFGRPITTEGIREIGVATLLHQAVELNVTQTAPTGDGGYKATWSTMPILSERARTGGGPSEEDLRIIAMVYQVAYATGTPPTKAVMLRAGVPRSTAGRCIRMARERGLLGPATPRKAGG